VLTGQFTARPMDEQTVQLAATGVRVGPSRYDQVLFPDAVRVLARVAAGLRPRATPTPVAHPGVRVEPVANGSIAEDALTQAQLWGCVQQWLPAGTAVLADTGTAFWGTMSLRLPADTVVSTQPIWNSIGYALPAVVGQGLADPDRRPVLVIGDGAAQMTVQDLSTIATAGVCPVILLLNNHGYTIERALQSPDAGYNDIAVWDWGQLLTGLAGARSVHFRVRTAAELRSALRQAETSSDALVLIEAELDRLDAPPLLHELAARHAGSRRPVTPAPGVRSARAADGAG
jgi:TPP-dependent 2-oxoacid decarboxylase